MKKTLAAAVFAAMSIVTAPPVGADGGDQAYLRYLDQHGVLYRSATEAITLAHTICAVVTAYPTEQKLVEIVSIMSDEEGDMPWQVAEVVTVGAVTAYCDQYAYLLQPEVLR
jgi:Protein of unknown function (DUF732)